ncbi:MAG: P-loop NTPase [Planctomycetota bacterium]
MTAAPSDQASRLRALVRRQASPSRATAAKPSVRAVTPILAIASGKGGVGKTVVAVHLSRALCRAGQRVTLIDADLGTANADLLVRVDPSTRLGSGACLAHKVAEVPGLRLVAGSVGLRPSRDAGEDTRRARREIAGVFASLGASSDLFVVDLGAGIDRTVLGVLSRARLPVLVLTPDPTSLADAYALYKSLAGLQPADARVAAVVVNKARDAREAAGVFSRFAHTAELYLHRRPASLGWLPDDAEVTRAVRERRLCTPDTPFSRGIEQIAARCRSRLCPPVTEITHSAQARRETGR